MSDGAVIVFTIIGAFVLAGILSELRERRRAKRDARLAELIERERGRYW